MLPLHINGILVDTWPNSTGVNAMSKAAANALNLKVDTEKVRSMRSTRSPMDCAPLDSLSSRFRHPDEWIGWIFTAAWVTAGFDARLFSSV